MEDISIEVVSQDGNRCLYLSFYWITCGIWCYRFNGNYGFGFNNVTKNFLEKSTKYVLTAKAKGSETAFSGHILETPAYCNSRLSSAFMNSVYWFTYHRNNFSLDLD